MSEHIEIDISTKLKSTSLLQSSEYAMAYHRGFSLTTDVRTT